jgi:hypothetical protein
MDSLDPEMLSQEDLSKLAQTYDATRAWREGPNGRVRWWCKTCRDEGREWLTPKPCEHILRAEPEMMISLKEAIASVEALRSQASVPNQVPDDPEYWNQHLMPEEQAQME